MKNVSGIGSKAAKKSEDFLMKTRYLNDKYGERNLILATGTPVSNSMTISTHTPLAGCDASEPPMPFLR